MSVCLLVYLSSEQHVANKNDKMSTIQVLPFYGCRIVNAMLNKWHNKLLGFHGIAFDTTIGQNSIMGFPMYYYSCHDNSTA